MCSLSSTAVSAAVLTNTMIVLPTIPFAAGDVYRRDSIDATHYPVFHQMEGVRVYSPADWEAAGMDATAFCEKELKASLQVRTA